MDLEEQYDRIYRYCYYRLYDTHTAQDITQETFLKFFEKYSDKSVSLPCLYTIAHNLCINESKKMKQEESFGLNEEISYDPAEKWVENIALRAIIDKLDADDKELLILRFANEVPIKSISKITGLSRFAVYRRISSLLKYLKTEIEKGCDEDD